jgi:hypothetical protein
MLSSLGRVWRAKLHRVGGDSTIRPRAARLCGKHDDRLIAATTTPLMLRGPIVAGLVEHGHAGSGTGF